MLLPTDVNRIATSPPRVWSLQGEAMRIDWPGPAHADAPFKLLLQVSGESDLRQGGRRTVLAPDALAFIDGARPFVLQADGRFEQVVVSLPRGLVTSLYRNIERRTATAHPGTGAQRLVRDVVRAYANVAPQMGGKEHAHATSAITHLLGAMDPPDAPVRTEQLYLKALALMDAQIERADAHDVARQLGVSRRYLDKLFARTGRSFTKHLWDRRLAVAAQWLSRPGPVSVTEVAHGVGFKDSSHFARMFRARYGRSPRDWPPAAAGPQPPDSPPAGAYSG